MAVLYIFVIPIFADRGVNAATVMITSNGGCGRSGAPKALKGVETAVREKQQSKARKVAQLRTSGNGGLRHVATEPHSKSDPKVPEAGFGELLGRAPGTVPADGVHRVQAVRKDANFAKKLKVTWRKLQTDGTMPQDGPHPGGQPRQARRRESGKGGALHEVLNAVTLSPAA
jgi:hypothetical protein